MTADVVVAGQLARDLVLMVNDVPEAGQSRPVRERREMLGGKGANQAVAVAQLGLRPALIAVAGDDEAGSRLLEQARRDRHPAAEGRVPGAHRPFDGQMHGSPPWPACRRPPTRR
jgi:sugar/nucleoside kinase (ribokinase family)